MNFDGRLSIGDLGNAAGVKVVTIRYYEQIKLMPAPARTEGKYRAYKQEHLHRLGFIRRCHGPCNVPNISEPLYRFGQEMKHRPVMPYVVRVWREILLRHIITQPLN